MIITNYIAREITRPFLTVVLLLGAAFASFVTAVLLNDVAVGLLTAEALARLVASKMLVALEVLVPVSLYFGVIIGLGRLHTDSEVIALAAAGGGEFRIIGAVLGVAILIALGVAYLSLVARPWAYAEQYRLRALVEARFDIADMEARRFFVSPGSKYALFANKVDPKARAANDVLVQVQREDGLIVILGEALEQPKRQDQEPLTLRFRNGYLYHLDRTGTQDMTVKFGVLTMRLQAKEPGTIGYKSKKASTLELSLSTDRKDVAEFQWRLSTPLASVLLAVLAVPLSRAPPRQGRYGRLLPAVAAFAVFYILMSLAKNLVQEGLVGPIPGLWWPILGLACVFVALVAWPHRSALARTS